MATVNLAPYDAQMAELDRRQRIAQALAAAGAEQQDVPAYKGISAMPSKAGMLANILKSFVGARQERNIGRERTILGKQDTAAGQEFSQQMLANMNAAQAPQQPPQAAQAPQGPFQGAPPPSWSPGQDASALPWDATSQGTAAPTETGPAAPQQLAAAMGGAPAAPQSAKMPGGNSPPQAMSPEQLQATIAAGLASPYPAVRAQAQALLPMANQHLQRSQQLADEAEARQYSEGRAQKATKASNQLGQSLLASIPDGTPDNVRFAVEAHIRIGDLDGAAKVLSDAVGGGGRKLVHNYDPNTRSYVWAFETPQGLANPGSVSIPNINPSDVDWH